MGKLKIEGGKRLSGSLAVHGAKNSALPLLAATILSADGAVLHNCPHLSDVTACIRIIEHLGCPVEREGDSIIITPGNTDCCEIPDTLMREMRSSIVFLGAIVARCGRAKLSFPGGCELGPRPIDIHLEAMKSLGVDVVEEHGYIYCKADQGLHGAKIALSFPSVGATENIMLAACMAQGTTVISNAAREPEIADLAHFLNRCGARISGAGEGTIIIEGVGKLASCEYPVMPDRIEAATYLACVAASGGEVELTRTCPEHLAALLPVFEQMGCQVRTAADRIRLRAESPLKSINTIRTMPYPGFPTDAQAPLMAVCLKARGTSVFVENIFENRFKHVGELRRMGANIKTEGRVAVVQGVPILFGTTVEATALRGGASLVIAALSALGETLIDRIHHLDRGYENLEGCLMALGANIQRI